MWRCIITMAHADGMIHDEERKYFNKIFNNMRERAGLSAENLALLVSDLSNPQDPFEMLKYINEPQYRSQVIYFARLLAYKDGELHPSEDALLQKLHAQVIEGVNLEDIKKEVQSNIAEDLKIHDQNIDDIRPDVGLSKLIDELFLTFDIDIMK